MVLPLPSSTNVCCTKSKGLLHHLGHGCRCVTGTAANRFKIKHEGPEEYSNMWQKSRAIWKYINFHYRNDFDWFVLGGDDLFLIVENLRKVVVRGVL